MSGGALAWLHVWARCRFAYGPADATATHSLASVKSRLVLPFSYRFQESHKMDVCVNKMNTFLQTSPQEDELFSPELL